MSLKENEWFIEVPWGKLCIVAWGSCLNPPVLLCHGTHDSAATFRPLVKQLPDKFYYVGMELPGNGKSDCFPPGLMINTFDLVYTVDAVVKHFRWEQFAMIGHSLGAYIGKMYNLTHPTSLTRLVEIDPINFFAVPPEDFDQWYHIFYTTYYENIDKYNVPKRNTNKHTWKKALEKLKTSRGIDEETAAATLERWSVPIGNGYIKYTLDPRYKLVTSPPFSPEHIKDMFTALKTQTLFIISKDSLQKGLYRNTEFLLNEDIYPNRNVKTVKMTGNHDLHITSPKEVASYVAPFLLDGVSGLSSKSKL